MTQPRFAPIELEDEVRPILRLKAPEAWHTHRPSELGKADATPTRGHGVPGPDQGYALALAARFSDKLSLGPDERKEDVIAGALAVALRRAALFGRAPVSTDIELALTVFGFLGDAPPELISFRKILAGSSHDSWQAREVSDLLTEETLRLTPAAARARLSDWHGLFRP